MSNSKVNCGGSPTESWDGEIILSPTADAVGESPEAKLELVGVNPSEERSMDDVQLEEARERLELATLSPGRTGSSVLGFWSVGYLWNLGLWRQPP